MSVAQTATPRRDLISASEGSTNIGFTGAADFALTLRVADCLSKSELVPDSYRGEKGFSNCVVALELAARLGISWMAVMQNLYVVYGRPAWMSSFLIANVNGCGRFHSLRFEMTGEGKNRSCTAWTCEKRFAIPDRIRTLAQAKEANLPVLEGTTITWQMVESEGWHAKKGSKWTTMPDQMFRYRAAAFWSRVYAPELTMGIRTVDEVEDSSSSPKIVETIDRTATIRQKLSNGKPQATPQPEPEQDEQGATASASEAPPDSEENGSGEQLPEEPSPSDAPSEDAEIILRDILDSVEAHKGDQAELHRIWTQTQALGKGPLFDSNVIEALKRAGYDPAGGARKPNKRRDF